MMEASSVVGDARRWYRVAAISNVIVDPIGRYPMVKYSWLEKMVTSGAVIVAYRRHEVPSRLMVSIVVTDIVWIPIFLVFQLRLRSVAKEH